MPPGWICLRCRYEDTHQWSPKPCPHCGLYADQRRITIFEDGEHEEAPITSGVVTQIGRAIESVRGAKRFHFLPTHIDGLDRVLGGGIVPGGLYLLTGDPSAGKSTIMVQAMQSLGKHRRKVLYATLEESTDQFAHRYRDLGDWNARSLIVDERHDVDDLVSIFEEESPDVAIIDSLAKVRTEEYTTGSTACVDAVLETLREHAKGTRTAIWVIGHVTKDGAIKGSRGLEHMVDVAIHLTRLGKNDRRLSCRAKNRFATGDLVPPVHAFFTYTNHGLVSRDLSDIYPTVGETVEEIIE